MTTDADEILILMKQIQIILNSHPGDETVGGAPYGQAFFSQDKEHPGRLSIGLFPLGHIKENLRFQISFQFPEVFLYPASLQDLKIDPLVNPKKDVSMEDFLKSPGGRILFILEIGDEDG
jgi:hypothetical protein